MAFNSEKRIDQIATIEDALESDRLIVIHGTGGELVTRTITKTDFLKDVTRTETVIPTGTEPADDEEYRAGSIWFDENYLYIAVTDALVKRVSLEEIQPEVLED